jgi:hypothetical protein
MANQLTARNDKSGVVTARSLALTVATVVASQVLAFAAGAQGDQVVGPGETTNPIFYPESLFVAFVVGVIVGMVAVGVGAKLVRRTG